MHALHSLQLRARDAFLFGRIGDLEDDLVAGPLPPRLQIDIYENNVRENFRKALQSTYEVVARLVGADCFAALARDYQRTHPSRSGDLEQFGDAFAEFLDGHFGSTPFAYFGDVARLEYLYALARFSADAAGADLSALAQVGEADVGRLSIELHPSVGLCASRFPVHSIWRAHQTSDVVVDLDAGAEQALIFRTGGAVQIIGVDAATCVFVAALRDERALAVALQRAAEVDEDVDVAAALHMLAVHDLITGVRLEPAPTT